MAFAHRTEAVTKNHVNLVARIVSGVIPDGNPAYHTVAYGSLKEPVRADAGKQFAFIYIFHDTTNISRTIPIEGIRLPGGITLEHTDSTKKAIKVTFPSGIPKLTEQLQALLTITHTIPVVEESTRSRSAPRQRPAGGGAPSPTAAAAASPGRPRSRSVARMRPGPDSPSPSVTVPAPAPSPFRAAATGAGSHTAPARSASARRQRPPSGHLGIANPSGRPPRSRTPRPRRPLAHATRSLSPPRTPDWRRKATVAATPENVRSVRASFARHLQRPVYFWHDEFTRVMKDAELIIGLKKLQSTLKREAGKANVSFKSLQSGISTLFTDSTDRAHGALESILKLINSLPEDQHASCVAKFMGWQFADMAKARLSRSIQSALAAKTGGASAAAPAPDGHK